MKELMLCLDIGGTHISAAVIQKENDTLINLRYVREAVDSMADRETILKHWKKGIDKAISSIHGDIQAIYVSVPGPFDYVNGISLMDGMHKYQAILHMNVKDYLSSTYYVNQDHIYFFNDAEAFLLGEIYHHNLAVYKVAGLTLGTGLGSALYEENTVRDLNYGSASFRDGIAEDYISTRGMVAYVYDICGTNIKEVKGLVDNSHLENEKIEGFRFLTQALKDFIIIYLIPLSPDYIVIGGSIAKAHHLFLEDLQQSIGIPLKIASMDELNLFYGMISNTQAKN